MESKSVSKNVPFVLMLFVMALILITSKYYVESVKTNISETKKTIRALRASSLSYEAKVMQVNRPSVINEKLRELGTEVKEPTEPPQKLIVDKLEEQND